MPSVDLDLFEVLERIITEATAARETYGHFQSPHEAYGVLAEEVYELLVEIHARRVDGIAHEAIQIAAVAARLVAEIEKGEIVRGL